MTIADMIIDDMMIADMMVDDWWYDDCWYDDDAFADICREAQEFEPACPTSILILVVHGGGFLLPSSSS